MDFEESLKNQYYFHYPNLEEQLDLSGDLAFQLIKVLRLKSSSKLILNDGKGRKALYEIISMDKDSVLVQKIKEKIEKKPFPVNLLCACLKKDKNEWLIQKASELSANHIILFDGDYSVTKIESLIKKEDRLKKIVTEAMEQSKNAFLPKISFALSLKEAISLVKASSTFYADLNCHENLLSIEKSNLEELSFIFGAEGGLSKSEEELILEKKINKIWLSPYILRAETAAITALSQARLVFNEGSAFLP